MNNDTFDFNSFLKESKEVFVNPKGYFATLKLQGGFTEPLIKAVIYGAIAGVFSLLWSVLNLAVPSGGFYSGGIGVMSFIWSVIGAVLTLFIGAVIILIISSICKGNTDFEANLRVSAVLLVIMPINAFLGFTLGINLIFGTIIMLGVNLLGLWLLINALIQALRAKPEIVKIVSYVLVTLLVLIMIAEMASRRIANSYLHDFNTQNQEIFRN